MGMPTGTLAAFLLLMSSTAAARAGMRRRLRGMARGRQDRGHRRRRRRKGLAALSAASIDQRVLDRDRAQGVFNQTFAEFSGRMINDYRLKNGAANLKKYADVFARAEQEFGVPGPVIAAFWALETDFGAVQGDFNTLNAVTTLAHDCRRPELFRPQLVPLLTLIDRGIASRRHQGRLGRRDRPDADPALRLSAARHRRRRRRHGRPARQRARRHHDHRQQDPASRLEARRALDAGSRRARPACHGTRPAAPTSCRSSKWSEWGVTEPRRQPAAGQRATGRPRPADGPQGPGLPDLRQLRHLPAVEPVLHLHADGGRIWPPALPATRSSSAAIPRKALSARA